MKLPWLGQLEAGFGPGSTQFQLSYLIRKLEISKRKGSLATSRRRRHYFAKIYAKTSSEK